MFEEWGIEEETQEQKDLARYKEKVKNLQITGDNYIFVMSFNGELTKSYKFAEIINEIKDKELIELCPKIYPNNFALVNDILQVKDLNITSIDLTNDQKIACNKFIEFMNNPTKKTFGLYGFSGTGKTTTIVELVSYLLKNKLIRSAAFSAPTNKAVTVMKNKFEKSIRDIYQLYSNKNSENIVFDEMIWKLREFDVNIEFSTIHKLLNFEFDFDTEGKLIFVKTTDNEIWKHGLIVVDECSMLPAQMVHTIFNDIRDDSRNIKIVFTGDTAQLPPVNERNSAIFCQAATDFTLDEYVACMGFKEQEGNEMFNKIKLANLERKYNSLMKDVTEMQYFVMEQVVRSKSNNVLGVCTKIRNWTLNRSNNFNIKKYLAPDCMAYQYTAGSDKTKSAWFLKFLEECKKSRDSIILTWTNKQCNEYNDAIRKKMFGRDKLNRFEIGDILMLSDFYNMKEHEEDEKNKFYTSEQIKVHSIEIGPVQIGAFQSGISKKVQRLEHSSVYESRYKKFVETVVAGTAREYKCWKLQVKRLSSSAGAEKSILYVIHEDDLEKYKADYGFVNESIKGLRNSLIAKFREKKNVIDTNIIKELWRSVHSIYVSPFAQVSYGLSVSTHKAQGSSFFNVYVDINDITKNQNTSEMKKCLYTAVSRTSNELHMLI